MLIGEYRQAANRLLVIDIDGLLAGGLETTELPVLPGEVMTLLPRLAQKDGTCVLILSGSDRHHLDSSFPDANVDLTAEHGVWTRPRNEPWELSESANDEWKEQIRPILELYVDRTPRSKLEEREFAMVWHYRNVNGELAARAARKCATTSSAWQRISTSPSWTDTRRSRSETPAYRKRTSP